MTKLKNGRAWRLALALAVTAGLVLTGCSQQKMLEKLTTPQDRALGEKIVADLQAGPTADADLQAQLNAGLRPQLVSVLPRMRDATPHGPGATRRLVNAQTTNAIVNGVVTHRADLAYEVQGGGHAVLVSVVIQRRNGAAEVDSFYVTPLKVTVEQQGAFSLAGKSASQYLVLALALLSFLTIAISEVVLVRTPGVRRKWLWFIGCLFGYGQISINWSTGALGFQPIYIQLLGAFAVKLGMLDSWHVGFGIPMVSVIFLALRGRLKGKAQPKAAPATDAPPPQP